MTVREHRRWLGFAAATTLEDGMRAFAAAPLR
jgi:hypothetical protein